MNLIFTGDTSITGSFRDKVLNDLEIFSPEIILELNNSDIVVCNLEGPTTSINTNSNTNTPLKSPTNTIKYLKERNITVFNLANNHTLDYGEQGLRDTINNIKNEKCTYFGAELTTEKNNKPVIIKKDKISVALFGITKTAPSAIDDARIFSSDNFCALKKQLDDYKSIVDFRIVNFHGGEEFTRFPSPVKRNFLRKIAKLDTVDCVIAHHSHTLQGFENYKKTPIFYSLGNFVFDIPNHKPYFHTDESALLKLHFTKSNISFHFIPVQIKKGKISLNKACDISAITNKLSDFSNYTNKWQKEAFRILFRKQNTKINQQKEQHKTLQQKSFYSLFLSKEFYRKIIIILTDKYMFSLYINALIYKFKKKTNAYYLKK